MRSTDSPARSDARRYPAIDPLDSWSKYHGIIEPESVARIRQLLRQGRDVQQMMTVVGEEGTGIDDFTLALKADFFDNCYLQQNAFDEVDAATTAERQKFVFAKVLEVIDTDFHFSNKTEARQQIFELTDLFRNWNYAAVDSDEYREWLKKTDQFIARAGQPADA